MLNGLVNILMLLFIAVLMPTKAFALVIDDLETKYRYKSLLYPWANYSFNRRVDAEYGTWGELHITGSDAVAQIEDCGEDLQVFCIKIPGMWQIAYSCDMLRQGGVWEHRGWKYSLDLSNSTETEFYIEARGKVMLDSPEDSSWNFLLSKEKGITTLVQTQTVKMDGELRASTVLHASGGGFGQTDRVCDVGEFR